MMTGHEAQDSATDTGPDAPPANPVLVIMGVSGTGKSTLGLDLAEHLDWPMQEGDDLHPDANVAKMAAGHPLDDADRAPWLARVAAWIDARIAESSPGIMTCSALKRRYRDVLRRDEVVFVHLTGSKAVIAERLGRRKGHYMPVSLLESQLDTLEPPGDDELAIEVPVESTTDEQAALVEHGLGLHVKA